MKMRSPPLSLTGGVALLALGFAALAEVTPRLVYNGSRSVPIGWYAVERKAFYSHGDLVLATPPEAFGRLIERRGYLPPGVPLIKHVAALPGDHVCYRDGTLTVTHVDKTRPVATVRPRSTDRSGRVMPLWTECRRMRDGEVFLLLQDTDASLDSRYFGPVPVSSIEGTVRPLSWR